MADWDLLVINQLWIWSRLQLERFNQSLFCLYINGNYISIEKLAHPARGLLQRLNK